ncbi:DUF6538 domain-containing protein [Azospirillum sp.]|uniref:DUF6538 domain-containing protein n=1 Tax=Azospirillum sp. TaxID=34012 RepID=UPI003D730C1B
MADLRFLKQRRQTWYFRIGVPADLRAKVGKADIVESLQTRDLSLAQKLRWDRAAHWSKAFDAMRGNAPQEQPWAVYRETLDEARTGAFGGAFADADGPDSGVSQALSAIAEEWERKNPNPDTPIDPVTQARIDALNDYQREVQGRTVKAKSAYGMPFGECAKKYLDSVKPELKKQTICQYEAVFRLFKDFIADKPMRLITLKDAVGFLDIVAQFDPNWGRSPKTKSRSFKDLQELYSGAEEGMAVRTLNRYVTSLSCAWKWAKTRQEAGGDNPFDGLFRPVNKKNSDEYVPFETDELNRLFIPRPANPILWEIPMVGLYTGMPLNEICSLAWENVRQENGIWHFDIVASKSDAGVRPVPLHDKLMWLLDRRANDPKQRLWPQLKPGGPDEKLSWNASKAFSTFRRDREVIGVGRKAFHSFRKNVVRCLERARVPQTEAAEIIGHEKHGITYRVYNPDGLTMKQRKEVIDKIQYDGFKFEVV